MTKIQGLTRREAIVLGAITSSLSAFPCLAATKAAAKRFGRVELAVLQRGVCDTIALRKLANGIGLPVQLVDEDLASLWGNDLNIRWRTGSPRGSIAGVSSIQSLLCLEQLAHLKDMRVLWKTEMPSAANAEPDAALPYETKSRQISATWSAAVGRVWSGEQTDLALAGTTHSIVTAGHVSNGSAVAWIIGPRAEKDRI